MANIILREDSNLIKRKYSSYTGNFAKMLSIQHISRKRGAILECYTDSHIEKDCDKYMQTCDARKLHLIVITHWSHPSLPLHLLWT